VLPILCTMEVPLGITCTISSLVEFKTVLYTLYSALDFEEIILTCNYGIVKSLNLFLLVRHKIATGLKIIQ
jgi:hypothetical protein